MISYYDDLKNSYENQNGFKEAAQSEGVENFDRYVTEYLQSDQQTLSTLMVKSYCQDGKRVFLDSATKIGANVLASFVILSQII